MARRRAFSFSISLAQAGLADDPSFRAAPPHAKAEAKRWVVAVGLREKDRELAAGLDRRGRPLKPIAASTRLHRRSAIGPADPNAPPLQPAYAVSRTRLLLEGEPTATGAQFWWGYDVHVGMDWGQILDYHRKGAGRLPRRDVIGISPRALANVRADVQRRWAQYARTGFRVPPVLAAQERHTPFVATVGNTNDAAFTYGIGANGAPAAGVQRSGFTQRRPGQGWTAYGGPNGPGAKGEGPKPLAPKPGPVKPPPVPQPKPKPPPPKSIAERIAGWKEGDRKLAAIRKAYKPVADLEKKIPALEAQGAELFRQVQAGEMDEGVFYAKWNRVDRRLRRTHNLIDQEKQRVRDRALAAVAAPEAERVVVVTRQGAGPSSLPGDVRDSVARGQAAFESLVSRGPDVTHLNVFYEAIPAHEEQRAFASPGGKIGVEASMSVATTVHELGHQLQYASPAAQRAIDEFLYHRGKDSPLLKLRDVAPNANFGDEEKGVEDDFGKVFARRSSAVYAGKTYTPKSDWLLPDGTVRPGVAREILSMGVELLYNDPVWFAAKDPEYCKLILGILDGTFRQ